MTRRRCTNETISTLSNRQNEQEEAHQNCKDVADSMEVKRMIEIIDDRLKQIRRTSLLLSNAFNKAELAVLVEDLQFYLKNCAETKNVYVSIPPWYMGEHDD